MYYHGLNLAETYTHTHTHTHTHRISYEVHGFESVPVELAVQNFEISETVYLLVFFY